MNPIKALTIMACCLLAGLALFWLTCMNHVGVTNIGLAYNALTGTVIVQRHPGIYVTPPWTFVAHMSVLPMRVTIPSDARIINQRMVRFKPEAALEFVNTQGFSWMLSSAQENIMLGYAFSGKTYPFLEIIEESKAEAHPPNAKNP